MEILWASFPFRFQRGRRRIHGPGWPYPVCADKARADHTKAAATNSATQPARHGSSNDTRVPDLPACLPVVACITSSQNRRARCHHRYPTNMAAAPSSLASSSHIPRRATATAPAQSHSPPLPQQLRPARSFKRGALAQHVRYSFAGREASRRRTPGACFVVSSSQPGSLSLQLVLYKLCVLLAVREC